MQQVFVLTPDRATLWEGEMAFLPQVGEYVEFVDGTCTYHEVVHVSHAVSTYDRGQARGATITVRQAGVPKDSMREAVAGM